MRPQRFALIAAFTLAPGLVAPSLAQDEGLADIDVGSSRIGGPGTPTEQRRAAAWDAEEELVTLENLPKQGSKKRIPALHKIAKRHFGGQEWPECCDIYDQILDEGGDEALDSDPTGRKNASRSFLGCAEKAYAKGAFEKAERLLKKSERYGKTNYKHANVRRKMIRDTYKKAMAAGSVEKALQDFQRYQALQPDEDERIWMGEQITSLAWEAYRSKDKPRAKRMMEHAEKVAPKNPQLRELKSKMESEENVLKNIGIAGGAAALLVLLFTGLSKWRSRRRVTAATGGGGFGKKNKFIDDDF